MHTRSGGGSDVGPPARMIRDVASNVSNAQKAACRFGQIRKKRPSGHLAWGGLAGSFVLAFAGAGLRFRHPEIRKSSRPQLFCACPRPQSQAPASLILRAGVPRRSDSAGSGKRSYPTEFSCQRASRCCIRKAAPLQDPPVNLSQSIPS
jgi:hypothetical protein